LLFGKPGRYALRDVANQTIANPILAAMPLAMVMPKALIWQ
jgi:hypothetical protein